MSASTTDLSDLLADSKIVRSLVWSTLNDIGEGEDGAEILRDGVVTHQPRADSGVGVVIWDDSVWLFGHDDGVWAVPVCWDDVDHLAD